MHYDILLPLPFNHAFTYSSAQILEIGTIVAVPFGSRVEYGIVYAQTSEVDSSYKIKEIKNSTNFKLSVKQITFLEQVAHYNLIPLGMVLKMILHSQSLSHTPKTIIEQHLSNKNLAELNTAQEEVYKGLLAKCDKFNVTLLRGVTGSGKTEVYLNLIYDVILQGKQALVLLPEILLSSQLTERFAGRFGFSPTQWHSSLTPKNRKENWLAVYNGESKFIVGARSALFLPFKNLGLIVVDEEHDSSFKQEEMQIYHARDMAILKAKIENIPIILSSATPSIETEYNVRTGKYSNALLSSRYGEFQMPEIIIADASKKKKSSAISDTLKIALHETFGHNKQSLLFLNRRGYAPVTLCGECKNKIECPNCSFNLVEHKSASFFQCHYCGYKQSKTFECKHCGSHETTHPVGIGVEKVAEEVQALIPEARVAVLSSDTLSSRKIVEEILQQIKDHNIDILVGTQIISKGLHFPNLDLVGILDADTALLSGDIRALERAYQMLHQVSGRAGRESDRGKVILQTLQPNSMFVDIIKNYDWNAFVDFELSNREAANMPPFSRLIYITISSRNELNVINTCRDLQRNMPVLEGIRILGPSPAPIFLLKNNYRYRFVVISSKTLNTQKVIEKWVDSASAANSVKIRIDVDPI